MEKSAHTAEYAELLALLRAARNKAGLTQVELSQKLSLTQSHLSKIERGEVRLDVIQLRAFCNAIGVPWLHLLRDLEKRIEG